MKKSIALFLILSVFSLFINYVNAHEGETQVVANEDNYHASQSYVAGYGSIIFIGLLIIIIFFNKKMNYISRRIFFYMIVGIVSLITLYLAITTIYLNYISQTKGPVHWHADFEIWVCGRQIELAEPHGMSNKQGTDLMHAHQDNRIHVEGVLLDKRQASIGAFFDAVHGYISGDSLKVPTDEGIVSVHNGDNCNSQPSKVYVFVNGKLIENPDDYVISPYEKVPPGDKIKIVFTEMPIGQIDTSIKPK